MRDRSRRSRWAPSVFSAVVVVALSACPPPPDDTSSSEPQPFTDITDSWGGELGEHHLTRDFCDHVERSAPPGACLFDFDDDGDVDLFTTDLEGSPNHFFENRGDKLIDISADVGLDGVFDSIGCLAFDYDADGDLDLLVTNNGPDQLYRNDDGQFANVTEEMGIVADGFSTTAAAGDIDGDGDLDLIIGRFLDPDSCDNQCLSSPHACTSTPDLLFENTPEGFVEVSQERGLIHDSQTLVTLFFDVDRDGDLDLYLGTDSGVVLPDRLYLNDGTGHFTDDTEIGLGHNEAATMGIAIGDVDGNGVSDLAISDFQGFASPLYLCEEGPVCVEATIEWDSLKYVRWNVSFQDFDGDGDLDVFQTSGHAAGIEDPSSPNILSWNDGRGWFENYEPPEGDALAKLQVSRGASLGDIDNDGDVDIIVLNAGGKPQVLRNDAFVGGWVGIDLDTQAAGARVRVTTDDRDQFRDVVRGGEFLGSNDPRLYFAVGEASTATVTVDYLDGNQLVVDVEPGRVHRLTRP